MNFQEYLNQAWSLHAKKPGEVAAQYQMGLGLVEKAADLSAMARLIVHVSGEHLGQFDQGLTALENLSQNQFCNDSAIQDISRSKKILKLSGVPEFKVEGSDSDQARIYATAAGVMVGQKQISRASKYLNEALKAAQKLTAPQDPAFRALAISGNNLACELEEKETRSNEDTELMILAAQTARKYWEMAGGPEEVAIAEYRLASTFLKAGNLEQAFSHAQTGVELCENSTAYNQFYSFEILAKVEKARGSQTGFVKARELAQARYDKLSDQEKTWCEASLKKLS